MPVRAYRHLFFSTKRILSSKKWRLSNFVVTKFVTHLTFYREIMSICGNSLARVYIIYCIADYSKTITHMKKSLLIIFFLGTVLAARAEWVVVQQDGTAAAVSHADVRRITFEGGNMVTLMADGTQQSVPIADIDKCVFFAPTQTGISQAIAPQPAVHFSGDEMTITGTADGEAAVIAADGTVVQRGQAHGSVASLSLAGLPKGVYVVKTLSGTFKIMKQ